jgi:hypothetical protein
VDEGGFYSEVRIPLQTKGLHSEAETLPYIHLSLAERREIARMHAAKIPITMFAAPAHQSTFYQLLTVQDVPPIVLLSKTSMRSKRAYEVRRQHTSLDLAESWTKARPFILMAFMMTGNIHALRHASSQRAIFDYPRRRLSARHCTSVRAPDHP